MESLYRECVQAFQKATHAAGRMIPRSYRIGGFKVCLQFAGPALVPAITSALAHLADGSDAPPHLTVSLWDSASTGILFPTPTWDAADLSYRREHSWVRQDDFVYVASQAVAGDGAGLAEALVGAKATLIDLRQDSAIYWTADGAGVPSHDRSAPLRDLFHAWMAPRMRQVTHCAAVGTPDGCVLIPGKSGSGKSSTALACAESGLRYIGDDYALVSVDPVPYAHSLYSTGKVESESLNHFPGLARALAHADGSNEKALFFLDRVFPERLSEGLPIRAILVPRITGQQATSLCPTTGGAALTALAASTLFQLTGPGHQALALLAQLVRRVPCYTLELGHDRSAIPGAIAELLSRRLDSNERIYPQQPQKA